MSLISCLSLLLCTEGKDTHFQWREEKKCQWTYLRLIKKTGIKTSVKEGTSKTAAVHTLKLPSILYLKVGVEGNQCCMLLTYSNRISKNIIKCLLSVFCQMCTDDQSCVFKFFPFTSFLHHYNPTDIWPELGSFEDLRYSRLHYSGQSLIVRFWRAILI